MDYAQRNFHNWENGKRKNAIGVIITLPQQYAYLFDKMNVAFVGEEFSKMKKGE